jgi:hypothetical protein
MPLLFRLARWCQSAMGCVYVVSLVGYLFVPRQAVVHDWIVVVLLGAVGLSGAAALAASFYWRRNPVRARWLSIASGIVNLFFIPLGTLLGVITLLVFAPRWSLRNAPIPPVALAGDTAPKKNLWLGALAIGLTAASTAFVYETFLRLSPRSLLYLVALVPCLFVSTIIHEAGHALFAALNGLQVRLYSVGALSWVRLAKGWQFCIRPKAFPVTGGRVGSSPLKADRAPVRLAWMLAGGVLMEWGAAVVLAGLLSLVDARQWPWLAHVLAFVFVGCVGGTVNLIPLATPQGETDGAHLRALWRGGAARAAIIGRWHRSLPETTALPYAECDPGPAVDPESNYFVGHALSHYYRALDRELYAEAGQWLDALVAAEASKPFHPNDRQCLTEAAWFAAAIRRDAHARLLLPEKLHGLPIDGFVELRAEAALARVEGNLKAETVFVAEAEAALDGVQTTGWTLLNRKLMRVVAPVDLAGLAEQLTPVDARVAEPDPSF